MRSTRVLIALIPLGALAMVATRYRQSWYFYDEWTMLERDIAPNAVRSTFELFNGHLYSFPSLAYRAQLGFGLEDHAFVWFVFCATLLTCNVAIARFLWVAGVPAVAATAAATAVTYFGPGAQLMTLEFQFGTVGAVAVSFFAATIVLRGPPSLGRAVAVATLLLAAMGFDSGAAAGGLLFVGALLAFRWRDRWSLVALGPAVVAGVAVFSAGRSSAHFPAGLGTEVRFGIRLLLSAAGGLVGGGQLVGAAVIAAACVFLVPAVVAGRMPSAATHCLLGGTLAAVVTSAILATTRVGLVDDLSNFNRYIGFIAFYLLVALLPSAVFVARSALGPRGVWVGPAVTVLFALTFVLNLSPLLRYRRVVESWQAQSRVLVAQAYEQLARGCPDGGPPRDNGAPLGALGPQVTVKLLRQLADRGSVHPMRRSSIPVSEPVREAICGP